MSESGVRSPHSPTSIPNFVNIRSVVCRYIAVCHPFQREQYCTTRRAVTVITLLSAGVTTLHAVQAYFWRYDAATGDCGVRPEVTSHGIRSLWSIWSWITELLAFGLVPVSILALNALVIAETRRMSANEARLMGRCRSVVSSADSVTAVSRVSGPSATTVMLLAVSFYLIVTTLPVTVVYAVYFSFPTGDPSTDVTSDVTWQRHLTYWTARTVVQEIGMSHYAGNFLIYVATGKIFRSELRRLLGSRCRWRRSTMTVPAGGGGNAVYRRHQTPSGGTNGYVVSSFM
jgi:7 transmembrane receptor (rhodopsin family)